MTEKKLPIRTCIACRREKPKREMLRIVKNAAGEIMLDLSGRLAGRGAYICDDPACIAKLRKGRLLHRTFSADVPEEVYARIEEAYRGKE